MSPIDPKGSLERYLAALDPAQLATLARRYQVLARQAGAYVILADGAEIAIPPIITPVVQTVAERRTLAADARLLVQALSRVARDLIEGGDAHAQQLLFSPLSALEHDAMMRTYREAERLVTVRVDFLVGSDGAARALEVNATIPAMQGYSDAIANGLLRAIGEQRGLTDAAIDAIVATNGSNTDDLLDSLLAHHATATGAAPGPRAIAIVARQGDSQGGELDHYVRRWSERGHTVWRATPEDITLGAHGPLANGRAVDLLYRHVFLRRVEANTPFASMLMTPTAHRIWNPPASHLELKGMLAHLSAADHADPVAARIGLTDAERDAVRRRLPWTRLCERAPARGPDGSHIVDLMAFAHAHQARLVLKRSWDYGGRGVFLGAELDEAASQTRLRSLVGVDGDVSWKMLLEHIERSGEAWAMQDLVDVRPQTLLRVEDTGPTERVLYADLSAFTSLGNELAIEGGAVRASGGRIVNIQGGGGLAPLLREEALTRLFGS